MSYGQCTVFDLPDTVQNKIVKTHSDLSQCQAKRVEDSTLIAELRLDKLDLQADNEQAVQDIEALQMKAVKRRKWPWIACAVGFIGGTWLGTQIRN